MRQFRANSSTSNDSDRLLHSQGHFKATDGDEELDGVGEVDAENDTLAEGEPLELGSKE